MSESGDASGAGNRNTEKTDLQVLSETWCPQPTTLMVYSLEMLNQTDSSLGSIEGRGPYWEWGQGAVNCVSTRCWHSQLSSKRVGRQAWCQLPAAPSAQVRDWLILLGKTDQSRISDCSCYQLIFEVFLMKWPKGIPLNWLLQPEAVR